MRAFKSFFKTVDPDIVYDPEELLAGIAEELEHTPYKSIAIMIAKHHLAKDKNYYSKLRSIHADETKTPNAKDSNTR